MNKTQHLSTRSVERAAQAWCAPETEHLTMIEPLALEFARILDEERKTNLDLLEKAWGIIANAGNGGWRNESEEWQHAAAEFRALYHMVIV